MSLSSLALRLHSAPIEDAEVYPYLVRFAVRCLDAGLVASEDATPLEFAAWAEAGRRRRIQNAVWAGLSTDPAVAAKLEAELGDDTSQRAMVYQVAVGLAEAGVHAAP